MSQDFFTGSPRYFFDLNAIRVPLVSAETPPALSPLRQPPASQYKLRGYNILAQLTRTKASATTGLHERRLVEVSLGGVIAHEVGGQGDVTCGVEEVDLSVDHGDHQQVRAGGECGEANAGLPWAGLAIGVAGDTAIR